MGARRGYLVDEVAPVRGTAAQAFLIDRYSAAVGSNQTSAPCRNYVLPELLSCASPSTYPLRAVGGIAKKGSCFAQISRRCTQNTPMATELRLCLMINFDHLRLEIERVGPWSISRAEASACSACIFCLSALNAFLCGGATGSAKGSDQRNAPSGIAKRGVRRLFTRVIPATTDQTAVAIQDSQSILQR
jgi:hypothetical protein